MSLHGAVMNWAGPSGVVMRNRVTVATLGPWSVAVQASHATGVVGDLTAPVITGADALETRDGWTLSLVAVNGMRWIWSDTRLVDRQRWLVRGIPIMLEATT